MILKFSLIMLHSLKIEADQVKLTQPRRPPAAIGRAAITKCCHLEDSVGIPPPLQLGFSGLLEPRSLLPFPSAPSPRDSHRNLCLTLQIVCFEIRSGSFCSL